MASLEDILDAIPIVEGFPQPEWTSVAERLDEDREEVWTDLARQWLRMLREAAGEGYEITESENFLILSSLDSERVNRLAQVGERALRAILDGLPGIAQRSARGKLVCLAFGSLDAYYSYISHFYAEGEHGTSGGVFLNRGYPHFALNRSDLWGQELVLVHELTHACLQHCRLPVWLEEGVTQTMTEAILPGPEFTMDRDQLRKHQECWRAHGLRRFWWGRSFDEPDRMRLSYSLAQVLARNLLSLGRDNFLRLLEAADPLDCGDRAVQTTYGLRLSDLATQFLGEGDWGWTPREAKDHFDRALLSQEQGAYEQARSDFEAAVEKDSGDTEHLGAFSRLLSTCPEDAIRDGPRALALATLACDRTDRESAAMLEILAAAHAELGNFEEAVKQARAAHERTENEADRQSLRTQIAGFERGEPCRDPRRSRGRE